ncbi:Trypsin [Oryctes borbonicus]|uniref:Trypsin n=1 Tax=Oryctes borbonicus TaxID=1629725 RepID=A0A0T6B5M8_9SCAR|nr:Trypsin [Oryctes borbonicus]
MLELPEAIRNKMTIQFESFRERIVGGNEAFPNSIPFQAALLLTAAQGTFFCGGSLISQRFVLTAAHCFDGVVQVQVILGAHRVQDMFESTQVRMFTTRFTRHPGWNSANLLNDIAIIELPEPAPLSLAIQVIGLPRYQDVTDSFAGRSARLSGWGLDSDSATAISPVLREVFVDVMSNWLCSIQFLGLVQNTHICTSGSGGRGPCNGDSGGPLVVGNMQIGIVSFGLALGCEIGWPSVLTRTTHFLDWIAANSDATIFP